MNISDITIKQIDNLLKENRFREDYEDILGLLKDDARIGVQKLYKRELYAIKKKQSEHNLCVKMHSVEKELNLRGYMNVAGVDEAGRGPLAGPVVAAAVILKDLDLEVLYQDSKQISESRREHLFHHIVHNSLCYSICLKDSQYIDETNILSATIESMHDCIVNLKKRPDYVLVDGNIAIPKIDILQKTCISGDTNIRVIAAASILAKVYRDRLMVEYDKKFPLYKFAQHKGYGTKEHIELIRKYGPCEIHRKSFLKNII